MYLRLLVDLSVYSNEKAFPTTNFLKILVSKPKLQRSRWRHGFYR